MENKKLRVLNLYAGIGGNRKLWGNNIEVTAVELDQNIAKIYQDFFPNDKVIIADAHQYLLEHYDEFDFIWSSPPCPSHSRIRKVMSQQNKLIPILLTLGYLEVNVNGIRRTDYKEVIEYWNGKDWRIFGLI